MSASSLRHPLLEAWGIAHGFGVRGEPEPEAVVRPQQVHGIEVMRADPGSERPGEADAIVSGVPGLRVAVVTADCLPILLADERGRAVAAVHAGWRGLARGVIPRAVAALHQELGAPAPLRAVVGPCIGPCCYEIDEPVIAAMEPRFRDELAGALRSRGGGHALLDLAALARADLARAGLTVGAIGGFPAACTRCDATRFHSYRRDGARAGRLLHWIACHPPQA
ncbi:MAG TPA: peptidoglycan editing factor PgeF [Myxococcota bacterium]|nr:peptidoglycan editing factor PgeF [Myxococcota bacterium]